MELLANHIRSTLKPIRHYTTALLNLPPIWSSFWTVWSRHVIRFFTACLITPTLDEVCQILLGN